MNSIPRRIAFAVALAAALGALLLAASTRHSEAGTPAPSVFIVELKQEPAAVYAARARQQGRAVSEEELQAYRASLRSEQDAFLADLRSRGVSAAVQAVNVPDYTGATAARVEFRYTLVYNGLALSVPRSAVSVVRAMPQVKGVHENTAYSPQLDHSVRYVNAPQVYGKYPELTQWDDFREGYEGQGMKVAVIDSGIRWEHAVFGGDATPPRLGVAPPPSVASAQNQKVIYYLPLIEALMDDYGHGTHVAADIAGFLSFSPGRDNRPNTADDERVHGVAPQAKIMGYKVCSGLSSSMAGVVQTVNAQLGASVIPYPVRRCESSSIIMAIEDAVSPRTIAGDVKPVADIINLSLGGGGGPDEPSSVACDNAVVAGAVVVASAGNSGPGEGTVGSPAAGRRVIAVGANNDPGPPSFDITDRVLDVAFDIGHPPNTGDILDPSSVMRSRPGLVDGSTLPAAAGQRTNMAFDRAGGSPPIGNAVAQYYVFAGTVTPQSTNVPASVSGRIAIARPSGLYGGVAAALAARGAQAAVLIAEGPITSIQATIPVWTISETDARYLLDLLSSADVPGVDPAVGALSEYPLRVKPGEFSPAMANFSSVGPVEGFGQVKPDVTAPGVGILSATTNVGVPAFSMQSATGYISANGTSFSGPHVAGAAALIKQAHPDWNADMIRTALINTATNLREANGAAKEGGLGGESINQQGGGLIDIKEALNAKALMGVAGDGIGTPTILGSHSYGPVPVVGSRTTHTAPVAVTLRDVSGEGGTYNLSLENNRDLQLEGVDATLGQTSVSLPPGGSATFTVNATLDGDLIRSTSVAKTFGNTVVVEPLQMQWYVTATRSDGRETLRMPFYMRPTPSLPRDLEVTDQFYEGIIAAGDAGANLVGDGVTYRDHQFEVRPGTLRIEARLDYLTQEAQDMDFYLLGPDGEPVKIAGIQGGPEILTYEVEEPGTYTYRVVGFANGPVTYTVTGRLYAGPSAPALQPVATEFTDAQGRRVDFDGAFSLAWSVRGDERGFEVERSADGGETWQVVATAGAGAGGVSLSDQPDGELQYRVLALTPGQIGSYVTPGGAAQSVLVDRRTQADISSAVETVMSNVSFAGGVFQLDLNLNNKSADAYLPRVELRVVAVHSASGTVKVANADNNGTGTAASPALFDYSNQLGPDQVFSGGETTSARTLRFSDPKAELFTYDVQVTAFQRAGGGATQASAGATAGGGSGGGSTQSGLSVLSAPNVLRFTANPLTKSVNVQLVRLR